jgi:hypothetical protein
MQLGKRDKKYLWNFGQETCLKAASSETEKEMERAL